MPKKTYIIDKFEGGLNTDVDPRDLDDNELAELTGAYIDKIGRIRTAGSIAQYDSSGIAALARTSTPTGYGLFQFGTDYDWEGVYTASEKFTVLTDDNLIKIHDDAWETTDEQGVQTNDAGTNASALQLHTSSEGADINNSFYYNNNALRCSCSHKNASSAASKWIGYIDNEYFAKADDTIGGNIGDEKKFTKKGWFIESQFIAPPHEVFIDSAGTNVDDCTDSGHWDEITAYNRISVSFTQSDGMDTNMSESLKTVWMFGVSFIYDGVYLTENGLARPGLNGVNHQFAQESSIQVLTADKDTNQVDKLDFTNYTEAAIIQVHFKAGSSRNDAVNGQLIGMNSRVTGMRFYIKEFEGEALQAWDRREPIKPWLRVAESDLCIGNTAVFSIGDDSTDTEKSYSIARIIAVNNDRGNTWGGSSGNGAEFMTITSASTTADTDPTFNGIPLFNLPSESYYSLNGYKDNHLIDCKYSTATVLNHSAYIGDIYDKTNGKYYGDRVIRTPKFKLDTFSTDFFVDIVPGDGDNIVKLENYADRLMVFKYNKLFIINVSQESMFIEQELNGMGVAFPGQVTKTDFGVIWCNKNGVYVFNGAKVQNLTDNKIKTTWDSFYTEEIDTISAFTTHDYTQIGYDPQSKHIVILKSNNAGHGDCLIYDMKIAGWTYLDSLFTDNTDKTNFFTSIDNKLIIHQNDSNNYILQYSDTSSTVASGKFSIKTKDYDFKNPHVRKKIHRVHVTYKCASDSNVQVRFDTDGGEAFNKDFSAGTNYTSDTLNSTSSVWAKAELNPDTRSEVNNIYSFALHFISTGTVPTDFEINDITIIYRIKGVK